MTMTTTSTTPVHKRDMQALGLQRVKEQAQRLRPQLAEHGLKLGNSQVLHMMARVHGFRDWHELKALLERQEQQERGGISVPSIPALSPQVRTPDQIRWLTTEECVRRLKQSASDRGLAELDPVLYDIMEQMLSHDDADAERVIDRRAPVYIEREVLYERLLRTRKSSYRPWRERGQERMLSAIATTPFDSPMDRAPVTDVPSEYITPVTDVPSEYITPEMMEPARAKTVLMAAGWKPAYTDLGSYFDEVDGPIAVISTNARIGEAGTLMQEMIDRAKGPVKGLSLLQYEQLSTECRHVHDAFWPRVERDFRHPEDYADMVDYTLSQVAHAPMKPVDKRLFLSIPWRPFDFRYKPLLKRAKDLNIQVILRVTSARYKEEELMDLEDALELCSAHVLAPKTLLPQHPKAMPIYNDAPLPVIRMR
jgi:hypothetical protein